MKNVFDSLRRRLIKKLGGYTEQFTPAQKQIIWQMGVNVQKFQTQISLTPPPPENEDYIRRCCMTRLTEKLLDCLEESACIQWESEFDKTEQKVNIRANLYVVNAADLPPHYNCGAE